MRVVDSVGKVILKKFNCLKYVICLIDPTIEDFIVGMTMNILIIDVLNLWFNWKESLVV
jgi:hypothetical protein